MGEFANRIGSRGWAAGLTAAAALSFGPSALAQTGPYVLDSSFGVQGTAQSSVGNFFYFNPQTGLPPLQAIDTQQASYADPTHGSVFVNAATPALPNPAALPAGTQVGAALSFGDLGTGTLITNAGNSFAPDVAATLPWVLDTGEMKSTAGSSGATGEIRDTLQITNPDWANDDGFHPFEVTLLVHVDRAIDALDASLYNFSFNVGDETYFSPGVPSPFSVNGLDDKDQAKSLIPGQTFTECTGNNFVSCGPGGYDLAFVFDANAETMFIHYDIFQSVFGADATTTVSLVTDPDLTVSSFSGRFGLGPTADGVPEPAGWASLLIGLGVMGAALRHRPARRAGLLAQAT